MNPYIKSDVSHSTWRMGARARISRGVYRAFHPTRNRSNYTSIGYVITQKIFIGAYSPFAVRTSASGLHFRGNFRNSRPELIHYRRHIAGAKRERSEGRIDGDIKLPASSINVTTHRLPPSQQCKRARTHRQPEKRRCAYARVRSRFSCVDSSSSDTRCRHLFAVSASEGGGWEGGRMQDESRPFGSLMPEYLLKFFN